MRCATYNVLADAYTGYGDYSHVDPELMLPGARTKGVVKLIDDLDVDVIGLQEVEEPLVWALAETGVWADVLDTEGPQQAGWLLDAGPAGYRRSWIRNP